MDKIKVLIADSDGDARKQLKKILEEEGYFICEAENGESALDILYREKQIVLLILDITLPKVNGWQVCREVRKTSQIPIVIVTDKVDETDELYSWELGIDDYIKKPISSKIFRARIAALLRRTHLLGNGANCIMIEGILLDRQSRCVSIDGKNIELSYKEFELLDYFIKNKGIALSRETILNGVWEYDYYGDIRTIDTHVKKLRSKMGKKGELIKTIWGMGYKFDY